MAAMKTMMVHVLDSSVSMVNSIDPSNDVSKFSLAKSAIGSFLLQRMLATKTIEFGLIRFGGDDGGNSFAEEIISISRPSLEVFKSIQEVQPTSNQGDIFEALNAAREIVTETNEGKKYNRVIVLYSDGESELMPDSEVEELARDMKNSGCLLFIVLFVEPSRIEKISTSINWFRKFVNDANGYLLVANDLAGAMKFLSTGPGMGTRPTQSKITFELSPDFKIPCVYCGKTAKVSLPSLKKQSNLSYDPDIPDSGKVSLSTVYRNPSDPDEELQFEDRVKGYKYGPQYIPFGGMDDNILKLISPPVIKLLGFLPVEKIFRHQFLDVCYILGSNHSTIDGAGARKVLAALGKSMKKLNQVALARLVKRENSDPWLVVLMPAPTDTVLEEYSDGSLIMHRLPCAEDIRNFLFPPLQTSFTSSQKEAISTSVESMTFKGQLGPNGLYMYNPASLALLSSVQQKVGAIDSHLMGITNFDDTFKSMGDTPLSSVCWQKVLEQFSLTPNSNSDRGSKKRKVYWADVEMSASSSSLSTEIKVEESDTKDQNLAPLHEGSVLPVDEFQAILDAYRAVGPDQIVAKSKATSVIRESLSTLERIIELLVTTGGTNAHYRKGVSCLKIMRVGAIEVGEHDRYNDFLRKVKANYRVGRHAKFWEFLSTESLTLISAEDTAFPCLVSRAEAMDYLTNSSIPTLPSHTEIQTNAQEDDDLFEDMM